MGTQSEAILDLPPTQRAREAARDAFEGIREIGTGASDLEETALEMSARMIDSARHAAIDVVNEALEGQKTGPGVSVKALLIVLLLGVALGAGLVIVGFGLAFAALHLGTR